MVCLTCIELLQCLCEYSLVVVRPSALGGPGPIAVQLSNHILQRFAPASLNELEE